MFITLVELIHFTFDFSVSNIFVHTLFISTDTWPIIIIILSHENVIKPKDIQLRSLAGSVNCAGQQLSTSRNKTTELGETE